MLLEELPAELGISVFLENLEFVRYLVLLILSA